MNKKKTGIILLILVVAAAVVAGGIFGYRKHKDKKTVVKVFPVAYLDWGWGSEESASSGTVTDDQSQVIKLDEDDKIAEVYVVKGDTVSVGTPLLRYDMESANLKVEMKELEVSTAVNDLTIANRELEKLSAMTPISESTDTTPQEAQGEENESENVEGMPQEEVQQPQVQEGYTAEELARKIAEKEKEIRDLDITKRKAELDLEQLKKVSGDGIVTSTVNGVVASVQDPQHLLNDGSAFMEIRGADSLYVTGALSEFALGEIQVGDEVMVSSWESGQMYDAVITEISTTPTDGNNYYTGEGNPNVSYYPYTASVSNSEGLRNGESVSLSITKEQEGGSVLCIEKAYVRTENGKSYVMIEGKNKRLKKQYVETGKTIYGQAVEITSGLDGSEYIAFPYGKGVKEGVKVKETDEIEY